MNQLLLLAEKAETAVDYFWTGGWWIALRRWWCGRKLTAALVANGDRSMAARWATERYHVLERSLKFWRISPPRVLDVLEASQSSGVPVDDLRLLALNREIKVVGNAVRLRQARWRNVCAHIARAVVLTQWGLLAALILLSPASWLAKALGLMLLTLLYWVLWAGFSLYSTRANAAVKRSGEAVEAVAMSLRHDARIFDMADFRKK